METKADEKILEKLGLDFQILDSGCCGMAGSFGFEKDKYEVSRKIGELVLMTAVHRPTAALCRHQSLTEGYNMVSGGDPLQYSRKHASMDPQAVSP